MHLKQKYSYFLDTPVTINLYLGVVSIETLASHCLSEPILSLNYVSFLIFNQRIYQ